MKLRSPFSPKTQYNSIGSFLTLLPSGSAMITKELGTSYFKFDFFWNWNLELSLEHRRKVFSSFFSTPWNLVRQVRSLSLLHIYDVIHCCEAAEMLVTDAVISEYLFESTRQRKIQTSETLI